MFLYQQKNFFIRKNLEKNFVLKFFPLVRPITTSDKTENSRFGGRGEFFKGKHFFFHNSR